MADGEFTVTINPVILGYQLDDDGENVHVDVGIDIDGVRSKQIENFTIKRSDVEAI